MKDLLFSIIESALLKSFPVTLGGLCLLLLSKKASAANRHLICVGTFLVLLALPLSHVIPVRIDLPSSHVVSTAASNLISSGAVHAARTVSAPASVILPAEPGISLPQLISDIYLFGLTVLGLRHLNNLGCLRRMVRHSKEYLNEGSHEIRLSDQISVAIAVWWKRPIILLPSSALEWSPRRLEATLRHEAAHIQRNDLFFSWIAVLLKLAYWPNPLVWLLGAKLLETAESGTDDQVVRSGIAGPDYAEVLLQTAKEQLTGGSEFSLAMVRSSKVRRRVQAVLDHRRNRGKGNPFAFLGVVAALIVVSMSVAAQKVHQAKRGTSLPNGLTSDLRDGLTVPADSSNDFTGIAADGRKVQLLQLARWTAKGIETWKPDGRLLPKGNEIPDDWHRHDPAELHLYTQLQNTENIDLSGAGIGSGPYESSGDPESMSFMGGYVIDRKGSGPEKTVMSLLKVPKPGSSGTVNVSFGYAETSGKPVAVIYPAKGETRLSPSTTLPVPFAKDFPVNFNSSVSIDYPTYGTPFVKQKNGDSTPDGHGGYVHQKVLSTELKYTLLSSSLGNLFVDPTAFSTSGKQISTDWNEGHQRSSLYDFSFFYPAPPNEIDRIEINAHKTFNVAYMHLHLRPNEEAKP